MSICLIGIIKPDNGFSAQTLLLGDAPERLVPLMRHLHDDAADHWPSLVRQLLEHPWRELSTAARHDQDNPTAVAGIGYLAPEDGSGRLDGHLTDPVPPGLGWLYLIDPAADAVGVYEATRHDRWLRHSDHLLDKHSPVTRQSVAPLAGLSTSISYSDVEDFTNGIRRGSIVLDPPYQRGSIWTLDQRIALMRSWLMGVPVAAIILNNRMGREWYASDPEARIAYAVVDGKQRLEAALAWENGDLAIPASWLPAALIDTTEDTDDGPYVRRTGLTVAGARRVGTRMSLPCVKAHLPDVEAEAELYLLVNGAGMANAARIARR